MNNNLENELNSLSDRIVSLESSIEQLKEIIIILAESNDNLIKNLFQLNETLENNK